MPLVTVAGTVGGLVNDVTDISETVENATGGVRNAMAQTTELTSALDEAQKNAAAAVPKVNVPNLEVPEVKVPEVKVPEVKVPNLEVPEVPVPSAAATSAAATSAAATSAAATSAASEPEIGTKRAREGGSRKRRRIAKLSRRIERTLRRVQKKYGLRDDKNSFLRRTLNAKKMK